MDTGSPSIDDQRQPPPYSGAANEHETTNPQVSTCDPYHHQHHLLQQLQQQQQQPRTSLDAASLLPSYAAVHKWDRAGHGSEREYLDALRRWVEDKQYTVPTDRYGVPTTLTGFYGKKTAQDYIDKARLEKQEMRQWKRRATVATATASASGWDGRPVSGTGGDAGGSDERRTRRKSIRGWLTRS